MEGGRKGGGESGGGGEGGGREKVEDSLVPHLFHLLTTN